MPATARVDAQILSDTAGKNQNKLTSNTGGKLDYKATCFLKLLTGLCIGQMVMLIAIAASLGAIIRNNIKEIDDLKQRTQKTENYIHGIESNLEAVQVGMATLHTTNGKGTSNFTTANNMFNKSLFISELHLMKNRTDTLESNMDTFGTDLSSLKTVTSVQEHVIQNNTYQIADLQFNRFSEKVSLELQSATTKELKADVKSQGDNFLALNETAVQLKTLTNELNYTLQNERSNIAQLEAIIQDISSCIVQLESNRSADRELIQRLMFEIDNHEDNVTELESNMAADRRLILRLSTDASSLKANLTSTTALIKTQGEILMAMNETLLQMGIVTNQLNVSSQANTDMLAEQDVEIERRLLRHQSVIETSLGNIGNNTDKIRFLKANVSFVQVNFENLRSNLTYLESKIATTNDGVENNTDAITALFVAMQALNGSTSDSISRLRTELTEINVKTIGDACSFDSDCMENNSICLEDICTCNSTMNYNEVTLSCEKECHIYSSTFTVYEKSAIVAYDHGPPLTATLAACKQACIDMGITCGSIDYNESELLCFLQPAMYQQVFQANSSAIIFLEAYNIYTRQC